MNIMGQLLIESSFFLFLLADSSQFSKRARFLNLSRDIFLFLATMTSSWNGVWIKYGLTSKVICAKLHWIMPFISIEKNVRLQWIFCLILYFSLIKYFHFSNIISPSKGVNLSMNIYLNSFHLNLCQAKLTLVEIDPMILEEIKLACNAFWL